MSEQEISVTALSLSASTHLPVIVSSPRSLDDSGTREEELRRSDMASSAILRASPSSPDQLASSSRRPARRYFAYSLPDSTAFFETAMKSG